MASGEAADMPTDTADNSPKRKEPDGAEVTRFRKCARVPASVFGRPDFPGRDFHRKYNPKPCWCHRTTVLVRR